MRVLMRLECLFSQVTQTATGQSEWDSRTALQGLFEIFNLTGRNEIKSELLKELERHSTNLNRLRQTPVVDLETLDAVLAELAQAISYLRDLSGPSLRDIRQDGFLSTVQRRSNLPGGTCVFDLPALHHWLQQDSYTRTRDLENWLQPLEPIRRAVGLILRLVRNSAMPREEIAVQGFFQKALDSSAPNQIIRVILPAGLPIFPEISAGRHRFSIRFMEQPDLTKRASQVTEDTRFQLVCCVF